MSNTVTFILLAAGACLLGGCAVGRTASGGFVVGPEIGTAVETAEQGLILGAGMIPVVGPMIAALLTGAVGSGLRISKVAKVAAAEIERRRKNSDQIREELRVELAAVKAKLEAANGGS